MTPAWIAFSVLFGAFGFGYFVYGRKQEAPVPLVCGLGLMIFPYFVSSIVLLVLIGAALVAAPFLLRD